MKIVLLGDSQVGKTSIISRITNDNFEEEISTIGAAFNTYMISTPSGTIQLQIWDTAGQEQYRSMTPMYYRSSDAILFVFDITNFPSFESIKGWIKEVQATSSNRTKFVLVGNKADLSNKVVTLEDAQKLCSECQMCFYKEVSAKSGYNIYSLFQQVAELGLNERRVSKPESPVSLREQSNNCC